MASCKKCMAIMFWFCVLYFVSLILDLGSSRVLGHWVDPWILGGKCMAGAIPDASGEWPVTISAWPSCVLARPVTFP